MSLEVTVEIPGNSDPRLHGSVFACQGSDSENSPERGGEAVGIQLKFTTRGIDNKMIDDRSALPIKGCRKFDDGMCKIGKAVCPVAGAISMDEYRERLKELRKLQLIKATY